MIPHSCASPSVPTSFVSAAPPLIPVDASRFEKLVAMVEPSAPLRSWRPSRRPTASSSRNYTAHLLNVQNFHFTNGPRRPNGHAALRPRRPAVRLTCRVVRQPQAPVRMSRILAGALPGGAAQSMPKWGARVGVPSLWGPGMCPLGGGKTNISSPRIIRRELRR